MKLTQATDKVFGMRDEDFSIDYGSERLNVERLLSE